MIREPEIGLGGNELKTYIDRFSDTRILVIGDIILDKYVWGHVSRISPEAPVPVVEVKQETKRLGGAANVLNNIASLGGHAILCGVVGDDRAGREIGERVRSMGLPTEGIITMKDRPTSMKSRVVAHNQQVVRFDREDRRKISEAGIHRILDFIKQVQDRIDAIIVADYGKGVISDGMMEGLRSLAWDSNTILGVDPKTGNFEYYKGVHVITPNHHEAGAYCGIEIEDEESLLEAGRRMLEDLEARSVLITQGKDGMTLFEREGEVIHIPTVARKVFDVTGAGDTVISTLCMSLASGMDLRAASVIANFAAGIVVGELGTSTVTAEELQAAVNGHFG
ncbi:MAG: D-glycero-beta-D-manno-heptose-7-phosphate kinase [Deltaproteobacteria bacterium]|nr:D-glycero-beta-D-manno-heptose-7-phosphate kinase [Deltaproteobacteria bacterium]